MLQLIKGAELCFENDFKEGYQIMDDHWLVANADAEKIIPIMKSFVDHSEELLIALFIEVPSNLEDLKLARESTETELGIIEEDSFDVYYLDDLEHDTAKQLLDIFGDILVNDGLSSFGLINQDGEEIGKYKYNALKAYSDAGSIAEIAAVFEGNSISGTNNLITIGEMITPDHPAISSRYTDADGRDIYDVVNTLVESAGMYFAERRA